MAAVGVLIIARWALIWHLGVFRGGSAIWENFSLNTASEEGNTVLRSFLDFAATLAMLKSKHLFALPRARHEVLLMANATVTTIFVHVKTAARKAQTRHHCKNNWPITLFRKTPTVLAGILLFRSIPLVSLGSSNGFGSPNAPINAGDEKCGAYWSSKKENGYPRN